MDRLVSHIEFLLHHYNCVIIPDFGGFVVNAVHSREGEGGAILPPACELVFNRDLTYNDGLMAQSYMKTYRLNFDSATLEIQNGVRDLKHRLYDYREVKLGPLGSFTMHEDKRIVYTPTTFYRPAFFGLSKVALKPLAVGEEAVPTTSVVPLYPETRAEERTKRARIASISAAAVAVIAVMLLFFPVGDSTVGRHSARMLSETEWFWSKPTAVQRPIAEPGELPLGTTAEEVAPYAGTASSIEAVPATDIVPVVESISLAEIASSIEAAPTVEVSSSANIASEQIAPVATVAGEGSRSVSEAAPKYYIILGVFSGTQTAQKMTDELMENGFANIGWLNRASRIDVYVASFTEEAAARVYLKEVHAQYPNYSDAWILKR